MRVAHAGSSGFGGQFETSSWRVAKSSTAEGGARVARKGRRSLGEAWVGIGSAAGSTSTVADAVTAVGRKCFCAGHVERAMRLRRGSWIGEYDRTLGGRAVSAFERRPSCRRYLDRARSAWDSRHASRPREAIWTRVDVPADVYPLVAPGVL